MNRCLSQTESIAQQLMPRHKCLQKYRQISQMNKNVADYTNFDGRTNKRIVQSPGGLSSISLGWGNDAPTGGYEQRQSRKNDYKPPSSYGGGSNNIGQEEQIFNPVNMKVMGEEQTYGQRPKDYGYKQESNKGSVKGLIGGQYGYNSYEGQLQQHGSEQQYKGQYNQPISRGGDMGQQVKPSQIYKPSTLNSNDYSRQQELDMALEQERMKIDSNRMSRNNVQKGAYDYESPNKKSSNYGSRQESMNNTPSSQESGSRLSIKVKEQQSSNHMIGGGYNYWQEDGYDKKYSNKAREANRNPVNNYPPVNNSNNNRPPRQVYEQHTNEAPEKTSVKVHNPPGGKSNFTFG